MSFSTNENMLSDKQLRDYGVQLSAIRKKLREEAFAQGNDKRNDDNEVDYQRLARKMHKGYFKKERSLKENELLAKDISPNE